MNTVIRRKDGDRVFTFIKFNRNGGVKCGQAAHKAEWKMMGTLEALVLLKMVRSAAGSNAYYVELLK